jgi:hypothetical protein
MNKYFLSVLILSLTLSGPVLAQAPKSEEKISNTAVRPATFTITGTIIKTSYAYVIRRGKPPERFAIMNPDPKVLDGFVRSAKIVTIEATRVMGDNVNIKTIDGEKYK